MDNKPFSVWNFRANRVEDGTIVRWKEEFEEGSSDITIVVRTEDEFRVAVDRFRLRVLGTWEILP